MLGRVLDAFDKHNLWTDTMLIVNTDHGLLMGEHDWWAKTINPWFQEVSVVHQHALQPDTVVCVYQCVCRCRGCCSLSVCVCVCVCV